MSDLDKMAEKRLAAMAALDAYNHSNIYASPEQRIEWEKSRILALKQLAKADAEIAAYTKASP